MKEFEKDTQCLWKVLKYDIRCRCLRQVSKEPHSRFCTQHQKIYDREAPNGAQHPVYDDF